MVLMNKWLTLIYNIRGRIVIGCYKLEARKTELIRDILNINNSEVLDKVRQEIRKWLSISGEIPCTYTLEEVKQRLSITEADAIEGKGISEEEADNIIHVLWNCRRQPESLESEMRKRAIQVNQGRR